MKSFLCIDYGQKNVGVAIATTQIADPLKVLPNNPKIYSQIEQLSLEHKIDLIVIGLPQGKLVSQIKAFTAKLNDIGLQTTFHDETLSSSEADAKLAHKTRRHRSQPQDAYQAAVILQDYLDLQQ